MCGRSNVGKSSLINALYKDGAAKTSKTPGRTQKVVVFGFFIEDRGSSLGPFYLFDLPGYGTARVSKETKRLWDSLMGTFFDHLPPGVVPVRLRDARHPELEADRRFEEFASRFGRQGLFVFNKIDKLKTQRARAELKDRKKELAQSSKKAFFVSAKTKEGLWALEEELVALLTV